MAARRGKSQARRSGNSGGLPGWAWMVLGIVLALLAVLVLPRYFKPDGEDGFFRPRPNPDARPAVSALDEDLPPPAGSRAAETSAPLALESGASHTLVGHSERRQHFGEDRFDAFDKLWHRKPALNGPQEFSP
jgi:hypothetical protein